MPLARSRPATRPLPPSVMRSIMGPGVSLGANNPYQVATSKPGRPASPARVIEADNARAAGNEELRGDFAQAEPGHRLRERSVRRVRQLACALHVVSQFQW